MKFKVLLKLQAPVALLMFGAIFGFVTIGAAVIVLLLHPDDPAFWQVMFSMLMGYAVVFGLLGASLITINDGLSFAFQYGAARQTLLKSTLATFALVGCLALALVSVAEALSQPVVGFAWTLLPGLNPGPLQLGLLWLLVMAVCSLEGWLFLVTLRLRPARRFKVVMSGLDRGADCGGDVVKASGHGVAPSGSMLVGHAMASGSAAGACGGRWYLGLVA